MDSKLATRQVDQRIGVVVVVGDAIVEDMVVEVVGDVVGVVVVGEVGDTVVEDVVGVVVGDVVVVVDKTVDVIGMVAAQFSGSDRVVKSAVFVEIVVEVLEIFVVVVELEIFVVVVELEIFVVVVELEIFVLVELFVVAAEIVTF